MVCGFLPHMPCKRKEERVGIGEVVALFLHLFQGEIAKLEK